MKLFVAENFLSAFAKLPKGIQKKVQEFIQKIKFNSLSHAIHLEPISTFKDPHLRTARVDLKYRAIIYTTDIGDSCCLLWVDNHDEAMQWAQNKLFNWNSEIQAFQIYEHKEINEVKNDRVSDCSFCGRITEEQLLKIGVPKLLIPSVKLIDNFEDLEEFEKYLPAEAFEHLFFILDGIPIEDVIKEIEEGKVKSQDFNLQINSYNNKRSLFEVKNDKDIEELLSGDLKKWRIFLHPTQRKLSEADFIGSIKVTGAAGTGKTVLALHRLKFLSAKSNKSKSILFTTYTRNLVNNLKEGVKDLGIDSNKIEICNFHHLVVEKLKTLNLLSENYKLFDLSEKTIKEKYWQKVCSDNNSEYDYTFVSKEYENIVLLYNISSLSDYLVMKRKGGFKKLGKNARERLWSLFVYFKEITFKDNIFYLAEITNNLANYYTNNNIQPFDYIIADEIQDFSIVDLRLLRAMVPIGVNDLFLTGDPLQNIYDKYTNFRKAGINILGRKSKKLRVNYRTTEEIKTKAISVLGDEKFENFNGSIEKTNGYVSLLHGEAPKYNVYKNIDELHESIKLIVFDITNNEDILYNEICVAARSKKYLDEIKKFFHKNDLPYFDVYEKTGNRNGIMLSSFHNMKGLEYKCVVLYNLSQCTLPLSSINNKEDSGKQKFEKALLYMAMTRAIKYLYICGVGEKSKLINF